MTERPENRRLGEGYEPHVDEIDGRLIYSLPVDSGHASFSRSFEITPDDLAALKREPYRRAALYMALHTMLQLAGVGDRPAFTQDDFRAAASCILFGSDAMVADYIATLSARRHIWLDHFIAEALARQSPAD